MPVGPVQAIFLLQEWQVRRRQRSEGRHRHGAAGRDDEETFIRRLSGEEDQG